MRPVQEAVIAINPDEVALLTEAMAVDARLTTIPRSGRPDDPRRQQDARPASLQPVHDVRVSEASGRRESGSLRPAIRGSFSVVETIMGQKRSLTAVPRP